MIRLTGLFKEGTEIVEVPVLINADMIDLLRPMKMPNGPHIIGEDNTIAATEVVMGEKRSVLVKETLEEISALL